MKIIYWCAYSDRFYRFNAPVEACRANGFGLVLMGYEFDDYCRTVAQTEATRARLRIF